MASTSVLVELVCGELGIDASTPMVERVRAAAQLVGIDFVSVSATTEALAAQLLPVTQEEDSDDDVVLTHVETRRGARPRRPSPRQSGRAPLYKLTTASRGDRPGTTAQNTCRR